LLVGVAGGLGYRISEAESSFRADRVYAGIIVIGIIGVLLERVLLRSLEVLTVDRWKGDA
jgi:ABC-type nitrate/sulfonate/bicarbonate transport system permease component